MRKVLFVTFLYLFMSILLPSCIPPTDEIIALAIEHTKSAEKTDTPEFTITPTAEKVDCQISEEQRPFWDVTFCETFEDNSFQWDIGTDAEWGTESSIRNGKYTINYTSDEQAGYTTGLSLATPFWESDNSFLVGVTGEMQSVFTQCTWGIMVNGFFDTGISFQIDNQGNYYVTDNNLTGETYLGNGKFGSHNAIKWDEPNTITVISESDTLTFFVNNKLIATYKFKNSNHDEISLIFWGAEGTKIDYIFDHIVIKEIINGTGLSG